MQGFGRRKGENDKIIFSEKETEYSWTYYLYLVLNIYTLAYVLV